ncbi:MAG: hypothetical protein ACK4WA_11080 [Chitinophagales bacterium]|jgi:hypothetical protein
MQKNNDRISLINLLIFIMLLVRTMMSKWDSEIGFFPSIIYFSFSFVWLLIPAFISIAIKNTKAYNGIILMVLFILNIGVLLFLSYFLYSDLFLN